MLGRILRTLLCLTLLAIGTDPNSARATHPPQSPSSLADPSLDALRKASIRWRKDAPGREVIDVVCLVPDLSTFFEAVATWDDRRFFPVLIEDVPNTLRFLRAFKPGRVVRYPKRAEPLAPHQIWDAAATAVGRAWTGLDHPDAGPRKESGSKPRSPGVVLSSPDSPSLAGAVALAAGRFQPLVRFQPKSRFGDTLDIRGLNEFALGVESAVASVSRNYTELGDDCDFVTLAGDWPYRYDTKNGPRCVDDLIARSPATLERWGFAGRLIGDAPSSVYAAMCSLFLNPDSAALFNSYPETGKPWSDYGMREAADRLAAVLPVESVYGEGKATLAGWHRTFDPRNRHGLVMINSKGGKTQFDLPGRGASTLDVPATVPTAVIMIHSFSAEEPNNPATIAGRWLANGAFIYHGSTHEPYLQSFRPPRLTADLIAQGLPLGAALRANLHEPFGEPWKLIYVGDPLYHVTPRDKVAPRKDNPAVGRDWPRYKPADPPPADADAPALLGWALQTAILRTTRSAPERPLTELTDVLGRIDRDRLTPTLRPMFDDLMADVLFLGGWYPDLRKRLALIPAAERPGAAQRLAEASLVVDLNRLPAGSFDRSVALWEESIRVDIGLPARGYATNWVSGQCDTPERRSEWRRRIKAALPRVKGTESEAMLQNTLGSIAP